MRFYFDENVHGAITQALLRENIDVVTAQEDGYNGHPDPEILERAIQLGRLLFTQDNDFLTLAHLAQTDGTHFYGILYCNQRKLTVGAIIADLTMLAEFGDSKDYENLVTYLPLP
jgi:predicted nuclease of predicted toxin-antitoxin system